MGRELSVGIDQVVSKQGQTTTCRSWRLPLKIPKQPVKLAKWSLYGNFTHGPLVTNPCPTDGGIRTNGPLSILLPTTVAKRLSTVLSSATGDPGTIVSLPNPALNGTHARRSKRVSMVRAGGIKRGEISTEHPASLPTQRQSPSRTDWDLPRLSLRLVFRTALRTLDGSDFQIPCPFLSFPHPFSLRNEVLHDIPPLPCRRPLPLPVRTRSWFRACFRRRRKGLHGEHSERKV